MAANSEPSPHTKSFDTISSLRDRAAYRGSIILDRLCERYYDDAGVTETEALGTTHHSRTRSSQQRELATPKATNLERAGR